MTAPVESNIAAALVEHVRIISHSLHQECLCGWVGEVLAYDHAAHQARAVLDAISEAGAVEWGVAWTSVENDPGFDPLGAINRGAAIAAADRLTTLSSDKCDPAYAVSRITLPWERAE